MMAATPGSAINAINARMYIVIPVDRLHRMAQAAGIKIFILQSMSLT
jgi:hypothetical protein